MSFFLFLLLNETLAYKDFMFKTPKFAILFENDPKTVRAFSKNS